MAIFNKINDFVEYAVEGMNLNTDQLAVAFSNTAPTGEASDPTTDANGVLANVTEVDYTNLSSRDLTTLASGQTGGVYKLDLQDLTVTTGGGPTGPFRYVYLYNDTLPAKPLIGWYDYGSSITLNDGDSFTLDFSAVNGVIQIT